MRAIVLGSGGSQPTPKAGCGCRVCAAARLHGGAHLRAGPSLWLPEHGVLVDTPEESNAQLNALGVPTVRAVLWSHFHPDHTAGLRVVEYLARWEGPGVPTYLPADLEESLEVVNLFRFARAMGHLEVRRVADREPFTVGALRVTPLRHRGEPPVYSYLFEDGGGRMLYNADHLYTLDLAGLSGLDLAVVQVGLIPDEVRERPLPLDHPARKVLLPLETLLASARALGWRRVVFGHLYETIRLLPEEYAALARRLSAEFGLRVEFAADGLLLETAPADTPTALAARLQARREAIAREWAHDRPRMRAELRALMEGPEQRALEEGAER